MDISDVRKLLSEEIITITFTKKDGTIREMLGTTMPEYLPANDNPSTSTPSPTVLTLWDLENGWRSIRFDSIQEIFTETRIYDMGTSSAGNS